MPNLNFPPGDMQACLVANSDLDDPEGYCRTVMSRQKEAKRRMMRKRFFSSGERERLSEEGKAMTGGGFPIPNVASLRDAIRAIGRAKNRAVTIRHIIRQARRLGAEQLVPEQWYSEVGIKKHAGPGNHSSGSPQSVHGHRPVRMMPKDNPGRVADRWRNRLHLLEVQWESANSSRRKEISRQIRSVKEKLKEAVDQERAWLLGKHAGPGNHPSGSPQGVHGMRSQTSVSAVRVSPKRISRSGWSQDPSGFDSDKNISFGSVSFDRKRHASIHSFDGGRTWSIQLTHLNPRHGGMSGGRWRTKDADSLKTAFQMGEEFIGPRAITERQWLDSSG